MRVPAPPSYPRHPETRLRPPEAGFLLDRLIRLARVTEPINVWDYERLAEQRLDANALAYFAGGAGDEVTLRDNLAAFERRKLRPRVLVDVSSVTTATTVLGTDVSMPVLIAPLAFQRMAHPDGEAATARAAAAAGTIMCLSSAATRSPREVAEACAAEGTRWFQVYVFRDRALTEGLIAEAVECGFTALVLTVDVPYIGRRERDLRVDFRLPEELAPYGERLKGFDATLSWRDLEWLAGYGLPVVVKGILTSEDAHLACEHGAAAVVVSNHGGRQLDGVPASLDALAEVVEAVDGRAEVLVDGGVRRGTDALKAIALGARAVLIGRAMLWGLAGAGEQGVAHVLELLRREVELGLGLLGCCSPAEVTRSHVT
ncbi:MAG: alpha-hydroxy-acid oxidizing protein [Actinobacteria bacterium]|nr:MAG: alpha-hydroxy-acid oxidizing protein [Actinomycetota bacterium]